MAKSITGRFFTADENRPRIESLQRKLDAADPMVTAEEMAALRNSVPVPPQMDGSDIEMFFRCLMQMARHLAKKYGFTIKQWPEK